MKTFLESEVKPIGIVGDGRVARHFSHYFQLLGIPILRWSRRAANTLGLPAAEIFLQNCDVVLLLVSDPAIDEVAARFSTTPNTTPTLFHFSGSWVAKLPHVHGAHPLMTFGSELYGPESYRQIPFIIEEKALEIFRSVFPKLAHVHPLYTVPRDPLVKAKYHAYCSMAGSFSTLLWTKLFCELKTTFDIPAEAAVPFLEQLTRNLATLARENPTDSSRFLTGPIARGDHQAIQKHLDALGSDPYRAIYEAFVKLHLPNSNRSTPTYEHPYRTP